MIQNYYSNLLIIDSCGKMGYLHHSLKQITDGAKFQILQYTKLLEKSMNVFGIRK